MHISQRRCLHPIFLFLLAFVGAALGRVQEVHNVLELTGQKASKLRFSTDVATGKYTPPEEMDPQFWYKLADEEIAKRLQLPQLNSDRAKNVIMFLGDGMPISTVTAARILKGQRFSRLFRSLRYRSPPIMIGNHIYLQIKCLI